MKTPPPAVDLPRITLGVLAIVAMLGMSAWVVRPFFLSVTWAGAIVIATWPILVALQARLGGRRGPAVAVMVVAMLALIVTPVWLGADAIVANAERMSAMLRSFSTDGFPPPPAWLERVPFLGERLAGRWQAYTGNPKAVAADLHPHVRAATEWILSSVGGLGATVLHLLVTVLISGVLYASGEKVARGILRFLRRLAGARGEASGILAAQAVRAVALGVVVTAVAQTALSAAGLFLAGVPHAGLLAVVVFVLCIAQVGPLLVVAPATIWLYMSGAPGRGTLLLVLTVVTVLMDNVLRPYLIKKGADLPLALILSGVIGGVMTLGVIGLFVGPVLLAVTWTLVVAWVGDIDSAPPVHDSDTAGGTP